MVVVVGPELNPTGRFDITRGPGGGGGTGHEAPGPGPGAQLLCRALHKPASRWFWSDQREKTSGLSSPSRPPPLFRLLFLTFHPHRPAREAAAKSELLRAVKRCVDLLRLGASARVLCVRACVWVPFELRKEGTISGRSHD